MQPNKTLDHIHDLIKMKCELTEIRPPGKHNKQQFNSQRLKTQKPRGKPNFFVTRTREMVPEPDFCYPNPSSIVMWSGSREPKNSDENPTFLVPEPDFCCYPNPSLINIQKCALMAFFLNIMYKGIEMPT